MFTDRRSSNKINYLSMYKTADTINNIGIGNITNNLIINSIINFS